MSDLNMMMELAKFAFSAQLAKIGRGEPEVMQYLDQQRQSGSPNPKVSEIITKGFEKWALAEAADEPAILAEVIEQIKALITPKLDKRTLKFIGHLLYDLNEAQVTHLADCLMHGTEIPAMDKLFAEWDGNDLTEQQVAAVGATL